MSTIVLGVSGGIAAYKACELLRRLKKSGHDVTVIPTKAALNFVGEATWAALSGHPIHTQVWEDVDQVPHVAIGQNADLVVVAPATADLLSRAAGGRADDLLTNVLLTAQCPVIMVPAMHTQMWTHAATQANVNTLRSRGVTVMEPADGRLTSEDSGPGRLPEPEDIAAVCQTIVAKTSIAKLAANQDLAGKKIVISGGGTREFIDPVRFIGNSSSGLMGISLARAAALHGADVTFVAANVDLPMPSNVQIERVSSTDRLGEVMVDQATDADVLIMAAAPADFTVEEASSRKIKKSGDAGIQLELVQTMDVLATLIKQRSAFDRQGQTIVGFAAETAPTASELLELGQSKLKRKGCDLLVLNDVSDGKVFGSSRNDVTVISSEGVAATASGDKNLVAHTILDAIVVVNK